MTDKGKGCLMILAFLLVFWGVMYYFNVAHIAIGLMVTITAGIFAWESTMLVEEKRNRRNGTK
tara:strand:+ start:1801 stop:1989 length:189 start_codon:yes stop_codon:yes gene_type:complete